MGLKFRKQESTSKFQSSHVRFRKKENTCKMQLSFQ